MTDEKGRKRKVLEEINEESFRKDFFDILKR